MEMIECFHGARGRNRVVELSGPKAIHGTYASKQLISNDLSWWYEPMASSTSNCQNRQLSMSKRRNRSQFNFLVARSRKNRWVGQIISGQAMFQEKIWPIQVPDTKIVRTSQIWSCPHPIHIHLMCRREDWEILHQDFVEQRQHVLLIFMFLELMYANVPIYTGCPVWNKAQEKTNLTSSRAVPAD